MKQTKTVTPRMRITQRNFDERARTFLAAKRRKESGEAEMKELKEPFVRFVTKNGAIPEHGKKSFAYATEVHRAIASFGQTAAIDAKAVEAFRKAFNVRGRGVSFEAIFEARTEYVVMPTALVSVERLPKKLRQLFKRVQNVKPCSPSLKVERLQSEGSGE